MSTPALTMQLEELRNLLNSQGVERHRLNNVLSGTIADLTTRQLETARSVSSLREDVNRVVQAMAESTTAVQALTSRLVGNAEMAAPGIVQEVNTLQSEFRAIKDEMKTLKSYVIGGFLAVSGLGALITWLQSHFHWPFGGEN